MSRPSRFVWVCTKQRPPGHKKSSCAACGGEELVRALKIAAGKAQLDVRVTSSGCFDLCSVGAAVGIMPDNLFFKHVTQSDIPALIELLSSHAASTPESLVEKLVHDGDFEPRKVKS